LEAELGETIVPLTTSSARIPEVLIIQRYYIIYITEREVKGLC